MSKPRNPLNIFYRLHTIDANTIEELRRKVYEYTAAHPDEVDIEDVRSRIRPPNEAENVSGPAPAIPNWMLKRLLIAAKVPFNVDSAMEKFAEVFKFRAQWKVNSLTSANTLPVEFYKIVPFIAEGDDREGNRLMIIRLKHYKKLPQFELVIKRAMVYIVEKMDRLYEQEEPFKGVSILMDITDFNYFNVDLDLLYFIIHLGFKYPGNVRNIFVYNLPFLLKTFLVVSQKMIDSLTPFKIIKLTSIDSKSITKYIAPEEIPDFLGGHRPVKANSVPVDAVSLEEMLHILEDLIEPANAKKIIDHVKELM